MTENSVLGEAGNVWEDEFPLGILAHESGSLDGTGRGGGLATPAGIPLRRLARGEGPQRMRRCRAGEPGRICTPLRSTQEGNEGVGGGVVVLRLQGLGDLQPLIAVAPDSRCSASRQGSKKPVRGAEKPLVLSMSQVRTGLLSTAGGRPH